MREVEIRESLEEAERNEVRTPRFIALMLLNASLVKSIEREGNLEGYMEMIGVPQSYKYQLKSIIKVPEELEKLGYKIVSK